MGYKRSEANGWSGIVWLHEKGLPQSSRWRSRNNGVIARPAIRVIRVGVRAYLERFSRYQLIDCFRATEPAHSNHTVWMQGDTESYQIMVQQSEEERVSLTVRKTSSTVQGDRPIKLMQQGYIGRCAKTEVSYQECWPLVPIVNQSK